MLQRASPASALGRTQTLAGQFQEQSARLIPKDSETALRLRRAFPRGLLAPVDETVAIIPAATLEPTRHDIGPVRVGNEPLHIPSRVYFPEPDLELVAKLGEIQRIILGCIYTRHHDGFVRVLDAKSWVGEPECDRC